MKNNPSNMNNQSFDQPLTAPSRGSKVFSFFKRNYFFSVELLFFTFAFMLSFTVIGSTFAMYEYFKFGYLTNNVVHTEIALQMAAYLTIPLGLVLILWSSIKVKKTNQYMKMTK